MGSAIPQASVHPMPIVARTTEGAAWGGGVWSYIALPPSPPPSAELYGAGRMGGMRYLWVRVPLVVPTLAFALLALWLWRRGRRQATGKGFEVQPVAPATTEV